MNVDVACFLQVSCNIFLKLTEHAQMCNNKAGAPACRSRPQCFQPIPGPSEVALCLHELFQYLLRLFSIPSDAGLVSFTATVQYQLPVGAVALDHVAIIARYLFNSFFLAGKDQV